VRTCELFFSCLHLLALWAIAHLYPLLYVFLAFTLAAALDTAVRFLNRLFPYPSAVIAAYLAVFGLPFQRPSKASRWASAARRK
jgi:predicted PurR-regulated permease PerM